MSGEVHPQTAPSVAGKMSPMRLDVRPCPRPPPPSSWFTAGGAPR
jgi:hypothetical protein